MRSPRMRDPRQKTAFQLSIATTLVLVLALLYLILGAGKAHAATPHQHHHHGGTQHEQRGGDEVVPDQDDQDIQPGDIPENMPELQNPLPEQPGIAPALPGQGPAQTISAEITGYSFQDNTPPGSATISMPVIHRVAGGTGTFLDPITTAVPGSAGSPETPRGTKLYVAKLRRYFIVEDSGASKEGGRHFDLYVDGQNFTKADSTACMDSYTGTASVILNPPQGEPVTVGPLTGSGGCRIGASSQITGTSTGVAPATRARTGHAKSTPHADAGEGDDG